MYLKDIYVNPLNIKTKIKSMVEIPEENLIITGSDVGEIRIFKFNRDAISNKSFMNLEHNPCLKLIKEIKVFDSPIKSMVFLPSREYESYISEKNVFMKTAENLKLKYFLVCSCTDGQISLIDLRNFQIERIYPFAQSQGQKISSKSVEVETDKKIKKAKSITNEEIRRLSHEGEGYVRTKTSVVTQTETPIVTEEAISMPFPKAKLKSEEERIISQTAKQINIPEEAEEQAQLQLDLQELKEKEENINEEIINANISRKLSYLNLPIYAMVYIPNRKTILFSQGADILEFNHLPSLSSNSKNKKEQAKHTIEKVKTLIPDAHKDEINLLHYVKEKNLLISCSKDNIIKIWNTKEPEINCIGVLEGSENRIYSICSGYIDGIWHIASLSKEGIVTFWNMENKDKTKFINFPFNLKSVQYSNYENIFMIIKKSNGFIIFDGLEETYKEYCNMDKINKELIAAKEPEVAYAKVINATESYIINLKPNRKIENLNLEKLNLVSLRLMSKYTCGIFVGNPFYVENDRYHIIFSNKLGNLDVWTNYDDNN